LLKRRDVLALFGAAAAAVPISAHAQQRAPRVGVLLVGGAEPMGPYRQALADLGYVEGRNIDLDIRSAQGQAGRLPELTADLVRSKVDIIVASLTPAITAAKNATRDIPIIMAPGGDPVATGLVKSLARPEGNITGVSGTAAELGAKSLELIREFVPAASRVGVVLNANDPFSRPFIEQIQQGAKATRFEVEVAEVKGRDDLEGAYAALARKQVAAVIMQGSLPAAPQVDLAVKHRLPTLSNQTNIAHAGALVAYGASIAERGRQIAGYIDKILKGAKPGDLPVQQPSTFEMTINLKTAKAIGLTVSSNLLARADGVIE
jgi:putative tryptophan/tyrosine transport system substrate-binding protein